MIKRTQACRIVVTGTFHGALFALAQGIPAVCLARAASYLNKLSGLADLFQPGCILINLDETGVPEHLSEAIEIAWSSADAWRPILLEAAERQIQWGDQAYSRIFELMESRGRLKTQESFSQ
jgi:colanic acid/amylovoran biosynthesis protein